MKNLVLILKGLFLAFGLSLISLNSYSQDIKLTRQEQKEARKAQLYANFQAIDTLLTKKTFVLEADYLENQYGYRVPVNSLVNFIKVNSPQAVLQTGSNYNYGYNGVGGVTAEGAIQNWKIDKNLKNLSYTIHFSITTAIGPYDVFMTIGADNNAVARISGLGPGELIWDGQIEAPYNSRVYKGLETY